ncbi:hypothetical protein Tco_1458929 [Tanacetum coccineum]
MSRRQGHMLHNMRKTFVQKSNVRELLKKNRKERTKADNPALVFQEWAAHTPQMIKEVFRTYMQNDVLNMHPTLSASNASILDLQHQLYMKMKSDLQSQTVDSDL